jgi:molecular chaperone GrpE
MEERKQADQQPGVAGVAAAPEADSGGEVCFDGGEMKEMMETLDEKNREFDELTNRLLRLQADFDNFRRRSRQEKEELSQVVAYGVLKELLPVLDNFERALAASTQDAAQLRTGVEMVYRQLSGIMERLGVTPIAAVGGQFDPARHEAVMRVEDADQADGLIVEELQKGYEMGGRVLRPSMVKVVNNA